MLNSLLGPFFQFKLPDLPIQTTPQNLVDGVVSALESSGPVKHFTCPPTIKSIDDPILKEAISLLRERGITS